MNMKRWLIFLLAMLQLGGNLKLDAVVHLNGPGATVQVIGSQASWPGCLATASAEKSLEIEEAEAQEAVTQGLSVAQHLVPSAPISMIPQPLVPSVVSVAPVSPVVSEDTIRAKKNIKKLEELVRQLGNEIELVRSERIKAKKEQVAKELAARERAAKMRALPVSEAPRGLEGIVDVKGKELLDLQIGTKPLILRMNGNARVVCMSDALALRPEDKIEIRGKLNELVVPVGLYLQGEIVFAEPDATLTVHIAQGARVVLSPVTKKLQLSPGAMLTCKGAGTLEIASGCDLLFDKQPSGACILIADQIQASMLGSQGIRLGGIGSFVLDQRACLAVKQNQQLIVGLHDSDFINVIIRGYGELDLAAGANTKLLFANGSYGLSVIEKGLIDVGEGAHLSLQDPTMEQGAICKKITITDDAHIALKPNSFIDVGMQAEPCVLDIDKAAIAGLGLITVKGFALQARMQSHGAINRTCSLGALARALINKQRSFSWATVFEDAEAKDWVFLPDGKVDQQLVQGRCVALKPGITVTSEDIRAKKVIGVIRGIFVEIDEEMKQLEMPRTRSFKMNGEQMFAGLQSFLV